MANLIAIVGRSGTGKSTSLLPGTLPGEPPVKIMGLDPAETVIINITGKPLPAKGSKTMFPPGTKIGDGAKDLHISHPKDIAFIIKTIDGESKFKWIKNIVVEDAQYLQMFTFMDKIKEEGWNKFNDTGEAGYLPLKAAMKCARTDLNIIFTYHSEKDEGEVKIKTAGKLIDAYLTIEGLFTVVLYTKTLPNTKDGGLNYFFSTKSDGVNTCKSPPGMFDSMLIPNDMGYVIKKVKEYYE